jgi:hypothetical protein
MGICHAIRRWALRLAAEDPADQCLRVRLRLLHQPGVVERAAGAVLGEGGGGPHAGLLPAQLHRRAVPVLGIIRSPDYTMEQLVRVARSLREEHGFKGYIISRRSRTRRRSF